MRGCASGPTTRSRMLCDRSEMGQGVYTALPTLIAEELDIAPETIRVEFAPPGSQYVNSLLGGQVTGGSTSVRDAWEKLRMAGAEARTRLVTAAANEWSVPPGLAGWSTVTLCFPTGAHRLASSSRPRPRCRSPRTFSSNRQPISDSSAKRNSDWTRPRRWMAAPSSASTCDCPECCTQRSRSPRNSARA